MGNHGSQKRGGGGPARYDHDHRFNVFFKPSLSLGGFSLKSTISVLLMLEI